MSGLFLPVGIVVNGSGYVSKRVYFNGLEARLEPLSKWRVCDDRTLSREGRWMRYICEDVLGLSYEGTFVFYEENGLMRRILCPDGTTAMLVVGKRELTEENVAEAILDYKLRKVAWAFYVLLKSGRIRMKDLRKMFTLKAEAKKNKAKAGRIFHSYEELLMFESEQEKKRILEIVDELKRSAGIGGAGHMTAKRKVREADLRREILSAAEG